jgi:hypothetical protein
MSQRRVSSGRVARAPAWPVLFASALAASHAGFAAEEPTQGRQEQVPPPTHDTRTDEQDPLARPGSYDEEMDQEDAAQLRMLSQHIGNPLLGREGERLGTVERIVRGQADGTLYVVVSTRGFLGFGGREVTVAADQVSPRNEGLQAQLSQKQLERMARYEPEHYLHLAGEQAPAG